MNTPFQFFLRFLLIFQQAEMKLQKLSCSLNQLKNHQHQNLLVFPILCSQLLSILHKSFQQKIHVPASPYFYTKEGEKKNSSRYLNTRQSPDFESTNNHNSITHSSFTLIINKTIHVLPA
ncbi:hypothetical protein X975_10562, partial [Stegodyphus mimosarum]